MIEIHTDHCKDQYCTGCECDPDCAYYEPTFDDIINPDGIEWEDDWDNDTFNNYTPRHAKENTMNKLSPIFGTVFRTFLLLGTILFILWVPYAIGEAIAPLLP